MEAFFQQLTAYFGNPAPAGSCEPGLMCFLQHATSYLAAGVEASAAVIIALAAIQATAKALLLFLRTSRASLKPEEPKTEDIRLRLGRWLALAIEFELAADILRTAISPTWNDIAQLAAIATIRTALNYFLQQEIDRALVRQGKVHDQKTQADTHNEDGKANEEQSNVHLPG